MMKNTARLIIVMLGITMLLTACNDSQSIVESPQSMVESPQSMVESPQSIVESSSAQETSTLESDKELGLPDAYFVEYGILYLKMEPYESDIDVGRYPSLTYDSVEEMKEKLLNLSFTEREWTIISKNLKKGKVAVVDPRLLAPLNLPEGVTLRAASPLGPSCVFGTITSDGLGTFSHFSARMYNRGGLTDQYVEKILGEWINKEGRAETDRYRLIEETTHKGYPALHLEKQERRLGNDKKWHECQRVVWRYIAEVNGRTYYVKDSILYSDSNKEEIVSRETDVSTMHMGYQYQYFIENPTEECVDNIFEYDPFTYVEIEE